MGPIDYDFLDNFEIAIMVLAAVGFIESVVLAAFGIVWLFHHVRII
jgi:hypothetical protein